MVVVHSSVFHIIHFQPVSVLCESNDNAQSSQLCVCASHYMSDTKDTYQIRREKLFLYAGPFAWNSLPHHVREITDTTQFKRQLKTVLFQRAFLDF